MSTSVRVPSGDGHLCLEGEICQGCVLGTTSTAELFEIIEKHYNLEKVRNILNSMDRSKQLKTCATILVGHRIRSREKDPAKWYHGVIQDIESELERIMAQVQALKRESDHKKTAIVTNMSTSVRVPSGDGHLCLEGEICQACVLGTTSTAELFEIIEKHYNLEKVRNMLNSMDRSKQLKTCATILVGHRIRSREKDPAKWYHGVIQDIESELEHITAQVQALKRESDHKKTEFEFDQPDLTPEGFVKFYKEHNIPLITDTDDEHWYQPYYSLWS